MEPRKYGKYVKPDKIAEHLNDGWVVESEPREPYDGLEGQTYHFLTKEIIDQTT